MGRVVRGGYRELVVPRVSYVVLYRILSNRVVIHRVIHASRRR